jgi:hypothetical protein
MALPTPAGAHPSPLDSLTLDFIVDQSGLVVIDGAANRDTYDQAPTPPERAAIAGQVVDALSIPGDTAQVDPEKSDLYHEVGFRISLHQAFANDGDDGVRVDTGVLQPIAAAFGTLTLDVCRVVAPGLTLSIDASAPSTSPDPSGAGAPQTDRVDCRTWVMRPEDPPVVVTAHVSSTPAPAPAPEPRATARVVLPCGTPTTGDPTFVDAELITYPAHVLQAHATGLSSSHLLEADTVLGFTTRTRVDLVVPKAQIGHLSFGLRDGPRATRRLTTPECKYAQARPWTLAVIRIWVDRAGCVPVTVTTRSAKRTVRFPVGAPC